MKLTYANKVAINENTDIPDINKVTDNDMNEIKTVVNNNDDDMITINAKLINATTYSTDETIIGIWMNKPLYRKVFTGNVASPIEHGLTNVSFVNSYGYMMSGGGAFVPLPSVRPTNAGYYIGYYVTNQYIVFDKAADANGVATITLEYTKTTD